MNDPNPRIKIHGMRAGETAYKTGDKKAEAMYRSLMQNPNSDISIQAMLSAKVLKIKDFESDIKAVLSTNISEGVKLVGTQIVDPPKLRNPPIVSEYNKEQKAILARGETIFSELCSQCHGNIGQGKPEGNGKFFAPALAGSFRMQGHSSYPIQVLLHGLEGPIDKKSYTGGMMASMKEQSDEWISDVLSYIRTELSNEASFISPKQVAEIRAATKKQTGMYKFDPLISSIPKELGANDAWEITASHSVNNRVGSKGSARTALSFEGWSTGNRQEKDMWYQIKFPSEVSVSELQFLSQTVTPMGYKRVPNVPNPLVSAGPRLFEVEASLDGKSWSSLKSKVQGSDGNNQIPFATTKTKYLRLRLDEPSTPVENVPWIMKQLKVFGFN